jgi:glc operon protein GlcG
MSKSALRFAIGLSIALAGSAAHAQAQAPAPASTPVNPAAQMSPLEYGAIISNANAKKVAAAALAEAAKMGVPMIVAITDTSGNVVYQERQDAAILGGTLVAPQKARSAVLYKRPTKAFEDAIAPGGVGIRFLRLEGAVPIEGGLPIIVDNKIIGGIGMSGGTGVQDGLAAKAGVDTLK